jgi:hypothetical protein
MGRRSGREKQKIREAKRKLEEEMTPGWILADAQLKEALENLWQKRALIEERWKRLVFSAVAAEAKAAIKD